MLDRPLAVQAGRGELDRQVGVQLGIKFLAALGPRLHPLKYRPDDRPGIEVPARDVEQRGLQRNGDRGAIVTGLA